MKMAPFLPRSFVTKIFVDCLLRYAKFFSLNRPISNQPKSVKSVKMSHRKFDGNNITNDVPIIIMHGLFGSKANFGSLGVSIQKRTNRIVYAVDARNHGDSPHTSEHSYIHLAEDIKLFMSDMKIKKAAFIGHSMGGRAVMVYGLRYPEGVESMTIVDISPIDVTDPMARLNGIIEALKVVKFKNGITLPVARRLAQSQLTKSLGSRALADFLTMNVTEKNTGVFGWKINVETISKVYETELLRFPIKDGEFKGPTLFIIGGDSDFVSLKDVDKIKKLFPQAMFEIIENTGHLVHVERPKIFTQIVCKFIKNNGKN